MKKGIINFILILVFVAVLFLLDLPIYSKVNFLRGEIKKNNGLLKEKQELLAKVNQLKGVYESRQDEIKRAYYVLPQEKDVPNLIVQFEALASENGLILEGINFIKKTVKPTVVEAEEPGLGGTTPTQIPGAEPRKNYETLEISLSLNGSYQSFRSFLEAIELNVRLMVIKSIDFTSEAKKEKTETEAGGEGFTFNINLEVYYQ